MSLFIKFIISSAILYAALVVALVFFQHSLVFPRQMVGPSPALPAQTERLTLAVDSDILHGVRIPGSAAARPTVLGFPGNAWNAEAMALFLHRIAPAHDIVVYHYRGYAPSTGNPSAQALMADALAIHDSLQGPVAADAFPVMPVRWLFRHDMRAAQNMQGIRAPVSLLIATHDEVIPAVRADALAAVLSNADVTHLQAGHNDIYNHPDFAPALRRALR